MDNGRTITGRIRSDEVDYLVVLFVRSTEDFAGCPVLDCSLLGFYTAPRVAVSSVKVVLLAIAFQAYSIRVQ